MMYMIKLENTVCHGCLSAERRLFSLHDYSRLFFYLLGEHHQKLEKMDDLMVCWECMELLRKIKVFQNKIRNAYSTLMHSFFQWEDLQSLSSLKIIRKDTFDLTIDYDDQSPSSYPVKEEENVINDIANTEEPVTKEECEVDYDLENIDVEEPLTPLVEGIIIPEEILIPEVEVEKVKKKKLKEAVKEIRRQSIRRYEKYATIIKKKEKINMNEIKQYYKKVFLSEKEMEEVLDKRDRKECGFNRMPLKCSSCHLGYKRKRDFNRHNAFHHTEIADKYKCSECHTKLPTRDQFETHWRRHTPMLRCVMCEELCRSLGEMRKHINRAHTALYTCKECNTQCGTLREFSNHYKNTHERLLCDHCGKGFFKKTMLEGHIKRNHLPAKCEVCGRLYSQYHVLENHLRTYHPHLMRGAANPDASYCVECDKQFASVYKYRRHIMQSARHTPQKRIRVPCPDCGKIFTRTTYMNNHYRLVHVKDTKHYCDLCNKFFATGYAVRKHVEYVHEKRMMPKNKICDICGRGFSTNRILNNHRRTHTGERPYKCPYCAATFAQSTAMHTHIKTQHKNCMPH